MISDDLETDSYSCVPGHSRKHAVNQLTVIEIPVPFVESEVLCRLFPVFYCPEPANLSHCIRSCFHVF